MKVDLRILVPSVLGIALLLFGSSVSFIRPGYVGVKVNLFGDSKGVDNKELTVGAHFVPPWKSIYRFPVFEQNHCWEQSEGFQFQTSDGMVVFADIGVTYRIRPEMVHQIFCRYRRGIEEITGIFLRNYIRDALNKAASHYKIEDLYSTEKEAFFEDIQRHVGAELREIGIEVSRIYLIGRFHFPDAVVAALNRKIEAMQRAEQRENELREAEAEARKQIAAAEGRSQSVLVEAKAKAEANRMVSESLTEEIIKISAIERWDGRLPMVQGGEGMPMLLDLKGAK